MHERHIMEPVRPHPETYDTAMMASGKPGLPGRFDWRGRTYIVSKVLETWKETTPDRGEHYVRRHGVTIRTCCGKVMKLTGARATRGREARWLLRSVVETPRI